MKTNILSLLAITGLITFAGCASDDTANKQNEQELGTEGLTSFVEEDNTTRTTGEYDGSGLNFYWTAGDRLWVNNGTLIQDLKNNINSKLENNPTNPTAVKRAARANFWFNGTFTASSYPVRYTGKNGTKDKVTIKASQTQTIPNDASHIGEDGDCGVATATKPVGKTAYHFTLNHKAAYITFLPYNSLGEIKVPKITKIKVSANEAIAGTYDFNDNGLDMTSSSSTSKSIELTLGNNFYLPKALNATANAATIVIAPGTYTNFTVEYTFYDAVTNETNTFTKTYLSATFTAGKNKKVSYDLQIPVYPGNKYYMWDAQQHYWAGYEWDGPNPKQPTISMQQNLADAPKSSAASSAHTPRDYNDMPGYTDATGVSPAITAIYSAANCPNVNELLWYAEQGEPHWDNTIRWVAMGHFHTGGMWFKKQSAIAAAQSPSKTIADLKAAAPNGINYTRSTNDASVNNTSITQGKPGNLNDFFYLPALGLYVSGTLWYNIESFGGYWSSTPSYCLRFTSGNVEISQYTRYIGFRVWTAQ